MIFNIMLLLYLKGSLVKNTVFQSTYVEFVIQNITSAFIKKMNIHLVKCLVERGF